MTILPLKHDVASLLTQLTIVTHNLKSISCQEIIELEYGIETYANIGQELAEIGRKILEHIEAQKE